MNTTPHNHHATDSLESSIEKEIRTITESSPTCSVTYEDLMRIHTRETHVRSPYHTIMKYKHVIGIIGSLCVVALVVFVSRTQPNANMAQVAQLPESSIETSITESSVVRLADAPSEEIIDSVLSSVLYDAETEFSESKVALLDYYQDYAQSEGSESDIPFTYEL